VRNANFGPNVATAEPVVMSFMLLAGIIMDSYLSGKKQRTSLNTDG